MIENLHPTQIVNILSKYIYKQLDGRYKFKLGMNKCDIYSIVYYQVPEVSADPNENIDYSDVNEMDLNINVTTYKNAIRININELSPSETTIGFLKYELKSFENIDELKSRVMTDIQKKIVKRYDKYEFVF